MRNSDKKHRFEFVNSTDYRIIGVTDSVVKITPRGKVQIDFYNEIHKPERAWIVDEQGRVERFEFSTKNDELTILREKNVTVILDPREAYYLALNIVSVLNKIYETKKDEVKIDFDENILQTIRSIVQNIEKIVSK